MTVAAASNGSHRRYRLGDDLAEGLRLWRVWTHLAWRSLKLDYNESRIGPLWTMIGLGVLIGAQGFLYSFLMRADLGTFYAWFSSGLITWLMISSTISSSVTLFRVNRGQMLNIDLPYSFYAYRITTVHLINFAFNLPIFLVVSLIVYRSIHVSAVLALFGVAVLFLNGIWANMFFGLVAARYKILAHLVPTVMPALFLFTPVMWLPENLGEHSWLINFNPFTHYVALVREPLMGKAPPLPSIVVVCLLTAAGFLAAHLAYRRWRRTIIFYA